MLYRKHSRNAAIFMSFLIALLSLLAFFTVPSEISAAVQYTFYASPAGSGSTCSQASPCSLTGARDKVRTVNSSMTGDIVINLLDGTYMLATTFQLTESSSVHDSGTNGHSIIYQAAPGAKPVLSGGQAIAGWTLYDSSKNIYKASVSSALDTRQLYVNGSRAIRARGEDDPAGFTANSSGFIAPSSGLYANMSSWKNPSQIEFVSNYLWMQRRCDASSITGSAIIIVTPCYSNAAISSISWIENAYNVLDAEGEWYLDKTGTIDGSLTSKLYYKPRASESMSSAAVIAPSLETLINASGTLNVATGEYRPLTHVQFYGITFSYATWLKTNTPDGYASVQAGFSTNGATGRGCAGQYDVKPLANVNFSTVQSIRLERNLFTHLGGAGLAIDTGSNNNLIIGNRFEDISSGGLYLGDVKMEDAHPSSVNSKMYNNTVKNNYIADIGIEYADAVGVFAGYTESTSIQHNEVYNTPYSGISVGWGWGNPDPGGACGYTTRTASYNNSIQYNLVHSVMQKLFDGGGIYTLGQQGDASLSSDSSYNYIYKDPKEVGALYHDDGTKYYNTHDNVVRNSTSWLMLAVDDSNYNSVHNNYSDTTHSLCCGLSGNSVIHNTTDGSTSAAAQSIINAAGIEAAYQDIIPSYHKNQRGNLALNKQAAAFYMDGSTATMHSNTGALNAVDGEDTSYAQATSQYRWQLQVDLGSVQTIGKLVVAMPSVAYATAFDIQAGDGTTFTTVKSITGFGGGTSKNVIPVTTARYVRIVAVTPNGPSQLGGQMAISELEVYGPDLALGKSATALYMDGTTATMFSGREPGKAVDGDYSTPSQAISQYRWQLQVDLGAIKSIERIVVTMPAAAYATEFDIQAGDGTTFTTIRKITSFGGGTSENTIPTTDARYIRIVAITPDGPSQLGGQMSILELEVYGL